MVVRGRTQKLAIPSLRITAILSGHRVSAPVSGTMSGCCESITIACAVRSRDGRCHPMNSRPGVPSRTEWRFRSARACEVPWHTRRLAGAPIAGRPFYDVVKDDGGEAVAGDDLDAVAVHLGKQHLSG